MDLQFVFVIFKQKEIGSKVKIKYEWNWLLVYLFEKIVTILFESEESCAPIIVDPIVHVFKLKNFSDLWRQSLKI